jgi:hypothetical protein
MSQLSRRCGNLDLSHPYGPSQLVTGIALPFYLLAVKVMLINYFYFPRDDDIQGRHSTIFLFSFPYIMNSFKIKMQ